MGPTDVWIAITGVEFDETTIAGWLDPILVAIGDTERTGDPVAVTDGFSFPLVDVSSGGPFFLVITRSSRRRAHNRRDRDRSITSGEFGRLSRSVDLGGCCVVSVLCERSEARSVYVRAQSLGLAHHGRSGAARVAITALDDWHPMRSSSRHRRFEVAPIALIWSGLASVDRCVELVVTTLNDQRDALTEERCERLAVTPALLPREVRNLARTR